MRIVEFSSASGQEMGAFGSRGLVLSPVLQGRGAVQVGCMRLEPGGTVGRHAAAEPQVFLVVEGSGWVEGQDGRHVPIQTGLGACWTRGEEHAAGTDRGLTAIVIEVDEVTLVRMPRPRQPGSD